MIPRLKAPGFHILPTSLRRLSHDHYAALVGALLAASILLSATDFFTTWVAIRIGLSEGNYALIALSQTLGLSLLATLEMTKACFIIGCCAASILGLRMRGHATGSLAIGVLACFVAIQFAVSVNNFSLIIA